MKRGQVALVKESVHCPYCEGIAAYLLSSGDANRRTVQDIFCYYRCTACGLIFQYPIPEDMRPFYKGGYQKIPSDLAGLREMAKKEIYRLDSITKYKKQGKLLEIGPWVGIFSCNAKDAGFEVTAIEIDPDCVSFLRDVVGIESIESADPAGSLGAMDKKFDVITLWHSLEHLPDPWRVIQKAADQLQPGGILLIAVPNIESYDFSVLKEKWVHLDAPRHLFFYTAAALVKVCSGVGLNTLEFTTSDRLSDILSRNAWCSRVALTLPIKYVRAAVGILLFRLTQLRNKGNGSGLTMIFVKPE